MKALLYKDFQYIWKYKMQTLFMPLLFCLVGLFGTLSAFEYYGMMLVASWPLLLMSLDESCKWNAYALTMPLTIRDLLGGKYLISFIGAAGYFLISLFCEVLKTWIHHSAFILSTVALSIVMLAFTLSLCFINIPIIVRFGVLKARYVCTIITVIGLGSLIGITSFSGSSLMAFSGGNPLASIWIAMGALAGCALLFFVSYTISKKISEKTEY